MFRRHGNRGHHAEGGNVNRRYRVALAIGDKGEVVFRRRGAPAARGHEGHGDNKNEPGRQGDFGATEQVPHGSAVSTRRHLESSDE